MSPEISFRYISSHLSDVLNTIKIPDQITYKGSIQLETFMLEDVFGTFLKKKVRKII